MYNLAHGGSKDGTNQVLPTPTSAGRPFRQHNTPCAWCCSQAGINPCRSAGVAVRRLSQSRL